MPSLATYMQGRQNQEEYIEFMNVFVAQVVKVSLFKEKLEHAKTDEDLCTVSDEAFARLLIENSYERWMDIYDKHGDHSCFQRKGNQTRVWMSDVQTKYSRGGIKYNHGNDGGTKSSTSKGWTVEGINRFNRLYRKVEKDRRQHPGFLKVLQEHQKTVRTAARQRNVDPVAYVPALHSLFDDMEDVVTSQSEQGSSSALQQVASDSEGSHHSQDLLQQHYCELLGESGDKVNESVDSNQ